MVPDFLHFLAMFLIAGFLVRFTTMQFPDTALARALAYIH
jgi:hypothetical protein